MSSFSSGSSPPSSSIAGARPRMRRGSLGGSGSGGSGLGAGDRGDISFQLSGPEASAARWVLGRKYEEEDLDGWTRHYRSVPWFTYRQGFRAMAPYPYTDDAGWGCMLRSAQMLMGQALLRHALGSDWRAPRDVDDLKRNQAFCDLLLWFADHPGPRCVYSIHNMVQVGMSYDKLPGEWYGPATAAYVLRDLAMVHHRYLGGGLRVLVTQAEVIYVDDVNRLCCPMASTSTTSSSNGKDEDKEAAPAAAAAAVAAVAGEDAGAGGLPASFFDPLLNRPPEVVEADRKAAERRERARPWAGGEGLMVVVPLRLGLATLNADYVPGILGALQIPHSLGFIGGKPNHAIYFVGNHGQTLIGLDPHTVQPAPEPPPPPPPAVGSATPAAGDKAAGSGPGPSEDNDEGDEEDDEDDDGYEQVSSSQPSPPPSQRRPEGGSGGGGSGGRYIPSDEYLGSVRCLSPQLMQARDLDPSLALAFYVRNEVDFDLFCRHAQALRKELARQGLPSPFTVEQAPPEYEGAMMSSLTGEDEEDEDEGVGRALGGSASLGALVGGGGGGGEDSDVEDEYVIVTAG